MRNESKTGGQKKTPENMDVIRGQSILRGRKRIRTAVAAFAELSLATRPSDQWCKCSKKSFLYNINTHK